MKKNFIDIYKRNVQGTFLGGFNSGWEKIYGIGVIVPIAHFFLLPLTLTFGAGIKAIIDFFSRKEIPEETLSSVNNQVAALDAEGITPLIDEISKYKDAKSTSSQKLIRMLHALPGEADSAMQAGIAKEKRALQEAQLGIDKNPELLNTYKDSYISNLPLDEVHQKRLDDYIQRNSEHCQTQQLSKQKVVVREYLGSEHNYGKRMQQIICNYFFPPAPTVVVAPSKSDEITPLPASKTNGVI